jgi:hypothetical protein
VSLKLMKRDMETNGSGGGAMNPIEGAGVQKSQVSHITIWIVCSGRCCLCCDWSHLSFMLTMQSIWRIAWV